jgi:acetate kinase
MTPVILTVNSGSSSIKFAVFSAEKVGTDAILRGKIGGIGNTPTIEAQRNGTPVHFPAPLDAIPANASHEWLIAQLLHALMEDFEGLHPVAVGHRVVHGGRLRPCTSR